MKRLLLLIATLLMALLPTMALPQGVPTPLFPAPPPGGEILSSSPGFGAGVSRPYFADEVWTLKPYARAGYMWMDWEFSFPFALVPGVAVIDRPANALNVEAMDLKLLDGQYWVGFVGAQIQPFRDLIAYTEMGGNLQRDNTWIMNATGKAFLSSNPSNPLLDNPPNTVSPWIWSSHNFQWWMIDSGIDYRITSNWALEAGFMVEHIDFKLVDPRNSTQADTTTGRPPGAAITCGRV
ncbi:MAG: hypothetical protein WBG50_03750 [Desulfomonilaceae bacterium]